MRLGSWMSKVRLPIITWAWWVWRSLTMVCPVSGCMNGDGMGENGLRWDPSAATVQSMALHSIRVSRPKSMSP